MPALRKKRNSRHAGMAGRAAVSHATTHVMRRRSRHSLLEMARDERNDAVMPPQALVKLVTE